MSRKKQTIYELLSDYSVEMINEVIKELPIDDYLLLRKRYGYDFAMPDPKCKLSEDESSRFYGTLIPKMRKMLRKKMQEVCDEEIVNLESKSTEHVDEQQEVCDEEIVIMQNDNIGSKDDKKDNVAYAEDDKFKTKNNDVEVRENISITPGILLDMIKMGKTNNEMCDILNIDMRQLSSELLRLKNLGITMSRKYYSDGTIKYIPISNVFDLKKVSRQNEIIVTDAKENDIKVLAISDLHFCNKLERIDLVNRAFEYCVKNGINIILCGGDFVDGYYSKGEQNITDLYKQAEYFLRNYPYDKNILTFGVAGDHDGSILNYSYISIGELCKNYRHDIIIPGFNNAWIHLKNDIIQLFHHFQNGTLINNGASIVLHGHSHNFAIDMDDNRLNIAIPTLSDIVQPMPTALELNLSFDRGYIKECTVKQVYFGEKDIVLGELNYDLFKYRAVPYGAVENIESYRNASNRDVKKKVLSINPGEGMSKDELSSQIEKFNNNHRL